MKRLNKVKHEQIERRFRGFTVGKLKLIRKVAQSDEPTLSIDLKDITNNDGVALGGSISSLVRTTFKGIPIIIMKGRTGRNVRLDINPEMGSKKEILFLIDRVFK